MNAKDVTTGTLAQDLDYALNIARQGQSAPLLGGEIGLSWTALASIALLFHGLALMGKIPLEPQMIGLIWLIYGVVGSLIGFFLAKKINRKPGAGSFANRVGEASWIAAGIMMFAVAISSVIGVTQLGLPYITYNFIVPFAYGVSALNNGLLARLTGFGYLKYGAISAGVMTVVTFLMVDKVEMYIVAAIGLLFTGVLTSALELRQERSHG